MRASVLTSLWILTAILAASWMLAGCSGMVQPTAGNGGSPSVQQAEGTDNGSGLDTSLPVQLSMYLLGSAPKGLPDVEAALNRKLKRDINATVQIHYIDWGELQSKYPMLLASGEPVDLIYTSDWNFYSQEAAKGAFLPLTQHMLKKYMPLHWKATAPSIWNATKIGGKYYMVPTSSPDRKIQMALIRDDLRVQYHLPEIRKFSELGPYLAAIKQHQPGMIPLSMDSNTDLSMPFYALLAEKSAYANLAYTNSIAYGVGYNQMDRSGTIVYQLDASQMGAERFAADTMKSWYDKGYIIKNPYANQIRSKDQFCSGKVGVALGNSQDLQATIAQCQAMGIPTDIIPVWWPNGKGALASPMNNGMAIGADSKHPDRALTALDLIMEDPSYNYLVYYGIEGKNYVITKDGKIGLPPGVTEETNPYPPDAAGFWFTDKKEFKPLASWTPQYRQLQTELQKNLVAPEFSAFSFNPDSVKSQMADISNVSIQYAEPIYIGAVANVDQAFKKLDAKLKAAGILDVQRELQKQVDAYRSTH